MIIVAGTWIITLMPILPKLAPYSKISTSLPYVAMGILILLLLVRAILYKTRGLLYYLAFSALACLMIVSNQYMLVHQVGNGDRDKEFKLLADWYVENAAPGEKMATTLPHVVNLYAPEYKDYFIKTSRIRGAAIQDFIKTCRKKKITYITWDSRIGLTPKNSYYKTWHMKRLAPLIDPAAARAFGLEFLTQIKVNRVRFINIFRLPKPNLPARPAETKSENKT